MNTAPLPKEWTDNEIKKDLYRSKKKAHLLHVRSGCIFYESSLTDGTVVYFKVPISDIGESTFYIEMEAKLLIRYLYFAKS